MARIRSIHPNRFTDEAFVGCSPLARIFFIGLWTDADDQGVFEWRPLQLRMRLLPGDSADAAALLAELETAGLVVRFEVGGKSYGAVRDFRVHQRPKKPNAVHPLPPEWRTYVGLDAPVSEPVTDHAHTVRDEFPTSEGNPPQMETETETEDVDGDGDGGRAPRRRSAEPRETRLPDDWAPTEADMQVGYELGLTLDEIQNALIEFRDYWRSRGGKHARRANWSLTFRNRLRDVAGRRRSNGARPTGHDFMTQAFAGVDRPAGLPFPEDIDP